MANPATTVCTKDTWVKVADSITTGQIKIIDFAPDKYLETYRVEDDPAPTDDTDAAPLNVASIIFFSDPVDIYVKAIGAAGKVRLDNN